MIALRRSDAVFLGLAAVGVAGVILNPLFSTWWEQHQAILGIVTLLALTAVSLEVVRSWPTHAEPDEPQPASPSFPAAVGFWIVAIAWATGHTVAQLTGTGTAADRAQCAARATNDSDMNDMREALLHFLDLNDYLEDQAIPATI